MGDYKERWPGEPNDERTATPNQVRGRLHCDATKNKCSPQKNHVNNIEDFSWRRNDVLDMRWSSIFKFSNFSCLPPAAARQELSMLSN